MGGQRKQLFTYRQRGGLGGQCLRSDYFQKRKNSPFDAGGVGEGSREFNIHVKKTKSGGVERREGRVERWRGREGEKRRIEIMQFQTFCAIKAFLLLVPPSLPPLLSSVIISIAPSRDPNAN